MDVMRKVLVWVLIGIVFLPVPAVPQQPPAPPPPAAPQQQAAVQPQEDVKPFKPEELDQLVAPIALHPDSILAQILMASTYPLEIVQAARFVKENPNITGDQLNEELKKYTWDDSVKSLVFFPQVLTMMDQKLDWLQKLGDAFLAQQQELMASIQRLRARAQAAGQLKSTPEQNVVVEPAASPPTASAPPPPPGAPPAPPPTVQVEQAAPTVIKIEPTNPQVVYVPSYNPTVVYGSWPPAYPPYYPYPPGYFAAGAFTFAAGMAVGAAVWGGCNWHSGGGEVNINNNVSNNFTNNVNNRQEASARVQQRQQSGTGGSGNRSQWQHNPEHRKGAQYRDSATQQRFNKSGPGNAQSRENFRGRSDQGNVNRASQQGPGQGGRGQQGGFGQDGGRGGDGGGRGGGGAGGDGGGRGGGGAGGGGGVGGDRGAQASQRGGAGTGGGVGGDRGAQASQRAGGGGSPRQAGAFDGAGGGGRDAQSFSNRGNASRQSSVSGGGGASRSAGGGGSRSGGGGGGARGGGGGGGGGRGGGRR